MALTTTNFFTRMLLMQRRGLDRSEALKYAAVLSANDTTQSLTATDAVVTDFIARRKAQATPEPTTPVEVVSRTDDAQVTRAVRELTHMVGRLTQSAGSVSQRSAPLELLQLLVAILQLLRDPAQQRFMGQLASSRDEFVERVQELLSDMSERLSSTPDSDDDESDHMEERLAAAGRQVASRVHPSFEIREMRANQDQTAVEVTVEDTSLAENAKNRKWDFGNGRAETEEYAERPTAIFERPGIETIRLSITSSRGGKPKSATQVIHIPPVGELTATEKGTQG